MNDQVILNAVTAAARAHSFGPEFDAVLLTGSGARGTMTAGSDVDVIVVAPPDATRRTRGNLEVHGVLLEYYVNPPDQYRAYFRRDLLSSNAMIFLAFAESRIVYDRTQIGRDLRGEAVEQLRQGFPRSGSDQIDFDRYSAVDTYAKLQKAHRAARPCLDAMIYLAAYDVYVSLARFYGMGVLKPGVAIDYFGPKRLFNALLGSWPDPRFAAAYQALLHGESHDRFTHYSQLLERALDALGPIDLRDWSLSLDLDLDSPNGARRAF